MYAKARISILNTEWMPWRPKPTYMEKGLRGVTFDMNSKSTLSFKTFNAFCTAEGLLDCLPSSWCRCRSGSWCWAGPFTGHSAISSVNCSIFSNFGSASRAYLKTIVLLLPSWKIKERKHYFRCHNVNTYSMCYMHAFASHSHNVIYNFTLFST